MRCLPLILAVLLLTPLAARADIIINMPGTQNTNTTGPTNPTVNPNAPIANQQFPTGIQNKGQQQQLPTFPPQTMPNPSAPGFQRACTQMWCREGVTINLPISNTPGQYRFVVVADGERYTCDGVLPLSRCGTPSARCDKPGISVGESGCALPAQQQHFNGLFLEKVPRQLEIDVSTPGRPAIQVSGPVMPQCFYPNGQQCDPRPCCQAQVNIAP